MMNTSAHYILGIFLFIGFSMCAQTYPELSGLIYEEIQALPNWYILTQAEGLLDDDSLEDQVVILESRDSIAEIRCEGCKQLPNKARIIAVLTSRRSKPEVLLQNNRFIARPNEGGKVRSLVPRIKIADKRLSIFYQYVGSNSIKYGFEFKDKVLVLVYAKQITDHDQKELVVKHYDFVQGNLTLESSKSFDQEKRNIPIEEFFATNILDISHHQMKPLVDFKEMYSWVIKDYHKL